MNKPLRRVISATLALSLSVTLAVNAYAEEIAKVHKHEAVSAEAVATKEKSEKAKKPEKTPITKDNLPEVLDFERVKGQGFVSRLKSEEQDMCEIVLENEDGTRGLYIFDSPVKFKNKNGETVDKSNKVKPHTKNGAPCFKSESNDIEVHLPATIQGGVSLKDEEVNVSMKPIPSVMSKRALSVGKQKDENSVVYEDVFDNFTDIVYTFTYDGVKEDIVLEKYNGKNTFDFEVSTGGLSLEEEKGALLLKNENGEVKATMGEIVIFSADNKSNTFGEYIITEKVKNNSYIITVCVDKEYLTSPDTKYPVTIDPPINSAKDNCGIEDMQVFKGTDGTGKTETSAGRSGVSRVGWTDWGACRTLMRFANLDLSQKIKDPKQINTAYIELRDLMCQGDATSIMCSEFIGNKWDDADQRTWNSLQAGSTGTNSPAISVSYGKGNSDNRTDKHWYRWDIKAIAKKWVGNKNYQNKGVIFRTASPTFENSSSYARYMKTFSSMQGSEIYKPYFYIEYNYYVPVTKVSLSRSSLGLMEGQTYTFYPTVTPSTATNQQFIWTSRDPAVATVSSSGKVTAVSPGIVTITVQSSANSSIEPAKCTVVVGKKDSDYDGIIDSKDGTNGAKKYNNIFNVNWKDEAENANYTVDYKMDYSQFFTNNKVYNSTISTISSLFAATVYDGQYISQYGSTPNEDEKTKCGISNLMKHHGMSEVVVEQLTVDKCKDQHITDVAIGHRRVICNGIAKEIIAVSVRGTNTSTEEWSSNFDIGCDDIFYNNNPIQKNEDWVTAKNHMGLDITANRVKEIVDKYISDHISSNSAIQKTLWITGHSRGGGIANILGSYYDSKYETFVYTFASPRTTTVSSTEAKSHKSIFNIINEDDMISHMPMGKWHFIRFGTDIGKSIEGQYKNEWKEYTGIEYKSSSIKMQGLIAQFARLSTDRNDCYKYHCSCHGDGTDNSMSRSSPNKENSIDYGEYYQKTEFEGYKGEYQGGAAYYKHCETTAFFMQYLARLASAGGIINSAATAVTDISPRYNTVRNDFISYYMAGNVKPPHLAISYYILSKKF